MRRALAVLSIAVLSTAVAGSALASTAAGLGSRARSAERAGTSYKLRRLVADQAGHAAATDPHLINAWGLAAGPMTPWWVNAADKDVSTLYDGTGAVLPLVVGVAGGPTGLVFNGGSNFVVSNGSASGPSLFLFATEGGTIRGWNPNVPPPSPSTHSFVVADRSGQGAGYKGLAIASTAGRLPVRDGLPQRTGRRLRRQLQRREHVQHVRRPRPARRLRPVRHPGRRRHDLRHLRQAGCGCGDEIAGKGLGYVDAFDTDGTFLARVATRHRLNAPWGLAMAPADFGRFSGDLLVGNFGDGQIHAFHQAANGSYAAAGVLRNRHGRVLAIDGLWGIAFGNGDAAGPSNALYFTAGPDDEAHGLFGRITATG